MTLRIDLLSKWFEENDMVLNADKCHVMYLGKDTRNELYSGWTFLSQKGPSVPKTCHTYPKMMKLGRVVLWENPKNM